MEPKKITITPDEFMKIFFTGKKVYVKNLGKGIYNIEVFSSNEDWRHLPIYATVNAGRGGETATLSLSSIVVVPRSDEDVVRYVPVPQKIHIDRVSEIAAINYIAKKYNFKDYSPLKRVMSGGNRKIRDYLIYKISKAVPDGDWEYIHGKKKIEGGKIKHLKGYFNVKFPGDEMPETYSMPRLAKKLGIDLKNLSI